MRNLVRDISRYARRINRNFGIITQGGLAVLEKEDPVDTTQKSPATTYIKSIDGINILGLNFHPPLKGKNKIITDKKEKKNLLRLADIGKKRGLKIDRTSERGGERERERGRGRGRERDR